MLRSGVFNILMDDFLIILLINFLSHKSSVKCYLFCINSRNCLKWDPNSHCELENKSCYCDDGYRYDKVVEKCISIAQTCRGEHDKSSAECKSYCINSQKCLNKTLNTYCDLKKKVCLCDAGYFYENDIEKCFKRHVTKFWDVIVWVCVSVFGLSLTMFLSLNILRRKVKRSYLRNNNKGRLKSYLLSRNSERRCRRVRISQPVQIDLRFPNRLNSQSETVIDVNAVPSPLNLSPSHLSPSASFLFASSPSAFTSSVTSPSASSLPPYDIVCSTLDYIDNQLPTYEEAIILARVTNIK